jgi:hypothetical protein
MKAHRLISSILTVGMWRLAVSILILSLYYFPSCGGDLEKVFGGKLPLQSIAL